MEKNLKKIRIIAVILIAILLCIVAFGGFYVKKQGIWENVIPDFKLGMELGGIRELHFVLDDTEEEKEVYLDSNGNYAGDVKEDSSNTEVSLETEGTTETSDQQDDSTDIEGYTKETKTIKSNNDEDINIENFEVSKKIIQQRLEKLDFYEYNIRQDTVTGEIIVELPDDDNIEVEQSMISTVGKLEIIDEQTGLILMDKSDVKKATMLASSENGYQTYLQLEFTNQGAEKLKEISKNYQSVTNEDGTQTTNYISILLDGQTISTTYFSKEMNTTFIQLPMGNSTENYEEYLDIAQSVSTIADIINEETMPLVYTLSSDNHINSVITNDISMKVGIFTIALIVIVSLYLIIRFRLEGLKSAILSIAYIALLSIIIRYTNIIITVSALIAMICVIVINYIFMIKFLKLLKETQNRKLAFTQTMKKLYLAIVPVCIIAIIFTFMSSVIISSIGMILFWGLFMQAIYACLMLL